MATVKAETRTKSGRKTRVPKKKSEPNSEITSPPPEEIFSEDPLEVSVTSEVPTPEWVDESEVPDVGFPRRKHGIKIRRSADITATLEQHMGRWLKVHKEYCTPSELYRYNKEKGATDTKVTVRGWSRAKRGESDFFYATIISGGLQGRVG